MSIPFPRNVETELPSTFRFIALGLLKQYCDLLLLEEDLKDLVGERIGNEYRNEAAVISSYSKLHYSGISIGMQFDVFEKVTFELINTGTLYVVVVECINDEDSGFYYEFNKEDMEFNDAVPGEILSLIEEPEEDLDF